MLDPDPTTDATGLVVRLRHAGELFAVPPFDPFDPASRAVPGIEEVVDRLRAHGPRRGRPPTLTLVLPAAEVGDEAAAAVRAAVVRYCDVRIARAHLRKELVVRDARSRLGRELLALPVLALAVLVVAAVAPFPPWLAQVLTPLVTITIWVAVWNPVDSLLFDRWEQNRVVDVHRALRDAAVHLVGAGGADP